MNFKDYEVLTLEHEQRQKQRLEQQIQLSISQPQYQVYPLTSVPEYMRAAVQIPITTQDYNDPSYSAATVNYYTPLATLENPSNNVAAAYGCTAYPQMQYQQHLYSPQQLQLQQRQYILQLQHQQQQQYLQQLQQLQQHQHQPSQLLYVMQPQPQPQLVQTTQAVLQQQVPAAVPAPVTAAVTTTNKSEQTSVGATLAKENEDAQQKNAKVVTENVRDINSKEISAETSEKIQNIKKHIKNSAILCPDCDLIIQELLSRLCNSCTELINT